MRGHALHGSKVSAKRLAMRTTCALAYYGLEMFLVLTSSGRLTLNRHFERRILRMLGFDDDKSSSGALSAEQGFNE